MPRPRKAQFAISLFSFQDIITSVSGVLILVVLLLILELTQRTSTGSVQAAFQASARQIRQSLENVSAELANVSAALDHSQEIIRRATENPQGELKERIADDKAAIDASRNQIQQLQTVAADVAHAEQVLEDQQTSQTESQARLAQLRAKIEKLEKELAAFAKGGGSHYSAPDGVDSRLAWVCDASPAGLRLYCMVDASKRHDIPISGKYANEKDAIFLQLQAWVKSNGLHYILFVFRPSSAEFGELVARRGGDLQADFGMDVVAEDHQLTDQQGAPIR